MRVAKAAAALRPGGALAPIATHHVAGGDEAFFVEVQASYERWDPDTPPGGLRLPAAAAVPTSSEELDRSGRFGPVTSAATSESLSTPAQAMWMCCAPIPATARWSRSRRPTCSPASPS
jgi:hypothetical protein